MSAESVGHALRERRKACGYTQQALADSIGTSRKFIVDLESGKERAAFGLALKAMAVLGLGITPNDAPSRDFGGDFARTIGERDYHYAIRLLGEYTGSSLVAGRALMPTAPSVNDDAYRAVLGAVTVWVSAKTRTPAPKWARNVKASPQPVFLAEKLHPVSDRMKDLIRRETPVEIAALNVWIRERDLATV
ncbi:helix-turn-helix domain-containing protein [Paenarthrobacter sp. NPDC018779]|uniref:helix-turn-helix domain-containing protein n=1 Tax=Paenarthrobacter sp. NPDC018779 TaxID=3364375 RepID=UPI0037C70A9D